MSDKTNIPKLRFKDKDGNNYPKWMPKRLGDIGKVAMNKRIYKDETSEYGEIPFYKIGNFGKEADTFITRKKFSEYKEKYPYPKKGDILISASGSIGRTLEYDGEEAYYQDSNIVWLDHDEQVINKFLKYFYTIVKWNGVEGTTIKRLYNKNILSTKINLPIVEEQEKIGGFFSKLDRQIELEEKKLELLEQQKRGYMQKIFSQELRFKDENGNEYPEWKEKTIKDVYKVTRGYVLARKLMSDDPNSINKYPVYSSQTSNNGLMGYYSDYLYQDAITWTTDGANAGSVSFRQGKFYCTNVCGVLLNELGNSNVCMAEMLNNIAFKYVSKVGNPKLMNNIMAMIKLKFPCLEEQQAISKFLNVFSEVIDNQNKKVELLKERKKGLLQKMFV